ncbi:DUF402 domain-containing protein [Hamadaea sp. NPDC051192]|uniref:DUF402 domain-containing protein n=1 Tax=Hamadaea sp. NPDC051192 TaxID=3154940 RepID=UPI00343CF77B
MFAPGQLLLHRGFVGERLVFLKLARVVQHDERGLLLWIAHGTPILISLSEAGEGIRDMPYAEWITRREELRQMVRYGPDMLMFIPPQTPGAASAHSVWFFWDGRHNFGGWYGNLEEPSVLWSDGGLAGVDTTDQDLDIWVWPDRTWAWKDEDEFEERLAFPEHYWVPDPDAVRAEGVRLTKVIEAAEFPFDGTWTDYRPDPDWTWPLSVPDGYDRPRAR